MYKKCNVVMLSTDEKAKSHLFINGNSKELMISNGIGNCSLYVVSDDEIKEVDYFINMKSNTIFKCIEPFKKYEHIDNRLLLKSITVNKNKQFLLINGDAIPKKIIATTDKSLLVDYKGYEYGTAREYEAKVYLPQLPIEFINEYITKWNKGRIIKKVLVEYDYRHDDSVPYPKTLDGIESLKINPKDNTITIKPIKPIKILKTISLHREIDSSPLKTHSIMNELTSEVNDIYIGSINDSTKEIVNITYMTHNDIIYCILTYSITK